MDALITQEVEPLAFQKLTLNPMNTALDSKRALFRRQVIILAQYLLLLKLSLAFMLSQLIQ